jgi:hypothetical protein
MLILPPGHAQSVRNRRAFSVRERWMLGGVGGLLAALLVALVISFASTGHKSGRGCIDVSLAYSTGGAEVYRCGAAARAMCAEVGAPGGLSGKAARTVTVACRKAGVAVG